MVRRARRDDAPAIVVQACRFIAESSYRGHITPDPSHQVRLIDWLLEHGAVFVAAEDEVVVGFLAFALQPSVLAGEMTACEIGWWVDPEYRTGGAFLRLLAAGEQWARREACVWIQMLAPTGSEVGRIYAARGYHPLETLWQRRLAA